MSPGDMIVDPSGVKWQDIKDPGEKLKKIMQDPWQSLDLIPGGGTKQVFQNYLEKKGLPTTSKVVGPLESMKSFVMGTRQAKQDAAQMRAQMAKMRQALAKVDDKRQTQRQNFDVANSAAKDAEAGIRQLKRLFPHRFRNL